MHHIKQKLTHSTAPKGLPMKPTEPSSYTDEQTLQVVTAVPGLKEPKLSSAHRELSIKLDTNLLLLGAGHSIHRGHHVRDRWDEYTPLLQAIVHELLEVGEPALTIRVVNHDYKSTALHIEYDGPDRDDVLRGQLIRAAHAAGSLFEFKDKEMR